jgi:hypothetical protein
MVRQFLICVLRLVLVAVAYLIVLTVLGQAVTFEMVPRIIGLFALSWMIGFVVPGAPGGLGIREAIFLMFMGDTLCETILISSVIIHRLACIFGDILAYVVALIYNKISIRQKVV